MITVGTPATWLARENIKRLTPRPCINIESIRHGEFTRSVYTESLHGEFTWRVYTESLHGVNDVRAEPVGGSH